MRAASLPIAIRLAGVAGAFWQTGWLNTINDTLPRRLHKYAELAPPSERPLGFSRKPQDQSLQEFSCLSKF